MSLQNVETLLQLIEGILSLGGRELSLVCLMKWLNLAQTGGTCTLAR